MSLLQIKSKRVLKVVFSFLLLGASVTPLQTFSATQAEIESLISAKEKRIDDLREQEIKQLYLVLSRTEAREKEADLLLRLAELYTERYKLYFGKENQIWNQQMDAFLARQAEGQKAKDRPQLDNKGSKQWLAKAIQVLEKIPLQKQKYEKVDEVYYFLGFNYWEIGRRPEAMRNFDLIARNYPESKFAPEANRYVGDYFFANRNFALSKEYYERAGKALNSPTRSRILYGLGWSYYKMRRYQDALVTMEEAIKVDQRTGDDRQTISLQRDAWDSYVLFYSEGGNLEAAVPTFKRVFGEPHAPGMLRKLTGIYQRQGKYTRALEVNRQLVGFGGVVAKESDTDRFEIMSEGLQAAESKADRVREMAILQAMTSDFVTNAKATDKAQVEFLRTKVRKAGLVAHKESLSAKNSEEVNRRAETLYRMYISSYASYAKPEDLAEVRFYLADVLLQLGQNQASAQEYKTVIESSAQNPLVRKYTKDSYSGLVHALDETVKVEASKGEVSAETKDQLIAVIQQYVQFFPNDKNSPKYLARAAGLQLTSKRYQDATPLMLSLVDKYPSSKEAWDGAATLLTEAEKRNDYANAIELSKLFLANRALLAQDKNHNFRGRLESIQSRAQFQQVKQVEENHDYGDAAHRYEKLAKESKDSEVKIKALNNAAVSYAKAGDSASELKVYRSILESNPGNAQARNAILAAGNQLIIKGQFSEAAEIFEGYYKIYEPKLRTSSKDTQKSAVEAIRSAALLRAAMQQANKATDDYRRIVDAANKGIGNARDTAGEFLYDTANRLRDAGNSQEALRNYKRYVMLFPEGKYSITSILEQGLIYGKFREEEKQKEALHSVIAKVKGKKGLATSIELGNAARARLELMKPQEEKFDKAPLRLPEAQLKKDVKDKLAALEALNEGYLGIMEFGDGHWGVEAFRRMAVAYQTFAHDLETLPIPPEYSEEDKAKFRAQSKSVAQPAYTKMAETLETALKKGESLNVVGPVMAKVYLMNVLSLAKPDRLPLIQTFGWTQFQDWIMGEIPAAEADLQTIRAKLLEKSEDAHAWVVLGNWYLAQNQDQISEIFYLKAAEINPKYASAINNLAYLRGKAGDLEQANAGFRSALAHDEFALVAKKNVARIQMASGLWRQAAANYKQLEARLPGDREVKRGIILSALAQGKMPENEAETALVTQGNGENGAFAEAVILLAKGESVGAKEKFKTIASNNEYARYLVEGDSK